MHTKISLNHDSTLEARSHSGTQECDAPTPPQSVKTRCVTYTCRESQKTGKLGVGTTILWLVPLEFRVWRHPLMGYTRGYLLSRGTCSMNNGHGTIHHRPSLQPSLGLIKHVFTADIAGDRLLREHYHTLLQRKVLSLLTVLTCTCSKLYVHR